ncbi:unnamed protein product [Brugia pahangi]|uniref:Uncharacterized protein n=1 Tax=Brugia pahangi TaxID=6280 RepID=A0A0N4TJL1_BRUPA|nr:unnamed protein product [Brugia pahangi]
MSADVVSSLRLIVCHFFGVEVEERWDVWSRPCIK